MYENFVLLSQFQHVYSKPNCMCSFDLDSLIGSPACCKSVNPTCISLVLINKKNRFMKSATFETDLSDHHKLTTTILRTAMSKSNS